MTDHKQLQAIAEAATTLHGDERDDAANEEFLDTFNPLTVLAMLDDLERLRKVEVLAGEMVVEALNLSDENQRLRGALDRCAGTAADEVAEYGKSLQQQVYHAVKSEQRAALAEEGEGTP